jgi:multidrug efflux pump
LPQEVQRQGISVKKSNATIMKIYGFISNDASYGLADLGDYVGANLLDGVSRLPGVGEAMLYASQFGMRIWLDPHKLRNYELMPSDILVAIQAQNAQISAGQLGGMPAVSRQKMSLSIALQERLNTAEEFGAIILRTNMDGSMVRIRDVARVEMGSESYQIAGRYMRQPSAQISVKLATGANALDTVRGIDAYMERQSAFFPQWLEPVIPYDTTPFVELSIREVIKALCEAIALVVLIMYLFLQNWRATIIPAIAVPVVLLGTFAILSAFGYSINTLTMFALVVAIGLLVDNAIVVVENVERVMHETGFSPEEATRSSMRQITGALVGIAVVLSAVFVPMSFMGGSVGIIYRQFSVTIVAAMMLSLAVAVILTPALCATLLKRPETRMPSGHAVSPHDEGLFGWFNRAFDRVQRAYTLRLGKFLHRTGRCLAGYCLLTGAMIWLAGTLPTGFLPDEDQGIMFVMVQLPPGATMEDTLGVVREVEDHLLRNEKDTVRNCMSVLGFSFAGRGQNGAILFVGLRDWSERTEQHRSVDALVARCRAHFASIHRARLYVTQPPPILELGNASGFDLQLQDVAGLGHQKLLEARNMLLDQAARNPDLIAVRPNGVEDQPQLRVTIDREKAGALGLNLAEINAALGIVWGSAYTDDFLDRGRVKKVYVQGDAPFRMVPEDMDSWHFRNNFGKMVPFSAFATCIWEHAPTHLTRYNGLPSMEIIGNPASGKSTGEAMLEMEKMIAGLPTGIGYEWTGLSYQERQSGSQIILLYSLSLMVVFLCLAALYESWSIPFSVMLVSPFGVLGALLGVFLCGFYNDVYFQVGILATVGLSAKNAILIVAFAREIHAQGKSLSRAIITAARLRLRPILMTSLALLLGILPLAISSGAGSGAQNALGIGILGGTLLSTFLGLFYIPVFFVFVVAFFSFKWVNPHFIPLFLQHK